MDQVLGLLWRMSYRAAVVITIVLLIRGIILRRFPKKYAFGLWGIVALCLVFPPVGIVSSMSLFNIVPDGDEVVQMLSVQMEEEKRSGGLEKNKGMPDTDQETFVESHGKSNSSQSSGDESGNKNSKQASIQDGSQNGTDWEEQETGNKNNVSNALKQKEVSGESTGQGRSLKPLLFWGWMAGALVLLLWNLVGWLKIKKQVKWAVLTEDNVYECEGIPGPFVLGVVLPKIYIPFHIEEEARQYILAHERYHIKRRDYLTKIAAVVILAVYWFHPLVWAAYVLMSRDMEMSCDEYVLAGKDSQVRVKYSESLLAFATNRHSWKPQRMAFDAHSTKRRIKNVLVEKKQKRYMGIVFCFVTVIVGAVLLTQGTKNETGDSKQETVAEEDLTELTVFVERASFMGFQEGWYGELLKQKFHVKLNITPYFENGTKDILSKSDILVWGDEDSSWLESINYQSAKEQGKLLPLSDGEYGHALAVSDAYHDDIFYTWDLRYDLYQKCGSPQIADWDDLREVLKNMQKQYVGKKKVYGASIWSEFDETNLFFAQILCSGYFGLASNDFVLYNNEGYTVDIFEKEGPYIQALRFLNQLYRDGLLDPDSRTNTFKAVCAKVEKGQILWSLADYAGSRVYNTEEHIKEGTEMYPVVPDNAVLAAYQTVTNKPVISVNANSQYGDLCKQVVEYICSPLGMMEMTYGPEGVCWYYDKAGKAHLTETGQNCYESESRWKSVIETDEEKYSMYNGMKFQDGYPQLLFQPYMPGDINTDTGEKYEAKYWESYVSKKEAGSSLWETWKDVNHTTQIQTYLEQRGDYILYSEDDFEDGKKPKSWKSVSKIVVAGSWDAVYASSEQEFQNCVYAMINKAYKAGYQECMAYSDEQVEEWSKE